jgi:SAM-dependent methyltransferase
MKITDENLEIVGTKDNFNDWMFDEIKQYVSGDTLEVGSGKGTFSKRLLTLNSLNSLVLSDISKEYISDLNSKFSSSSKTILLDIGKEKDLKNLVKGSFDTIVCLNVLEHVKGDLEALKNLYLLLRKNGKLIILVPSYNWLYNSLDKSVLHYRRYNKKYLFNLIKNTNFKIENYFYFNAISIFGWFVNGLFSKDGNVNENGMGLLNKIVPVAKFIDKYIFFKKIGLSKIVILKK